MAFEHDRRYKQIFSKPYFLQKLLESFVHESFIKELDFDTLKRLDKSFVNSDFQEKESDLVFSIRFKDKTIYIFLLLEFQSTVDKLMPVRFLRYITELYASLKPFPESGRFPAVFPVLLYTGDPKWTTKTEISDIIEKSVPDKYIPKFSYYPICENEIPKSSLLKIKNAVSAIFYVENSSPEELEAEIDKLIEIINDEDLEIASLFSNWLNNYLSAIDGFSEKDFISRKVENVMEVKTMFATKMKEYEKKLLEQGIEQGIEQERRNSVNRLKNKGFSNKEISEILDILVEDIEDIEKE